jgi:hypothetical protein
MQRLVDWESPVAVVSITIGDSASAMVPKSAMRAPERRRSARCHETSVSASNGR